MSKSWSESQYCSCNRVGNYWSRVDINSISRATGWKLSRAYAESFGLILESYIFVYHTRLKTFSFRQSS